MQSVSGKERTVQEAIDLVPLGNTQEGDHQGRLGKEVIGAGTFACGTVIVDREDFIAENLTFEKRLWSGSGK
ncbi:hypothetical protein R1flu_017621 [Riccia fluitans]|uniref:Uncharacterized protein n=1 Tax=Riccia fluitans TaxID=41844 RepID=A0ABD1ZDH2_9MARC